MLVHCTRLIRVAILVAAVTPIETAAAQADTMPPLCWRPRPGPVCPAYIPTEFGFEYPVLSTSVAPQGYKVKDFGGRFVMAIGLMKNLDTTAAVGGLFALGTSEYGWGRLRAEARYRRWIGDWAGVDVGFGVAQRRLEPETGNTDVRARGLTAGVGLDFPYVGMDFRIDALRGGGRSRTGSFVGIHANSQAAPSAAIVGAIAGLAAALAIAGALGG